MKNLLILFLISLAIMSCSESGKREPTVKPATWCILLESDSWVSVTQIPLPVKVGDTINVVQGSDNKFRYTHYDFEEEYYVLDKSLSVWKAIVAE